MHSKSVKEKTLQCNQKIRHFLNKPYGAFCSLTTNRSLESIGYGNDVNYRYDVFGRRIAKDMDGKTTQFIWQGDRLIAENIYQKGVYGWPLYRSYVYEPGTFKPMALLKGHGTINEV